MRFRDFVYLDTDALARYSAQLESSTKARGMRAKELKAAAGANVGVASASLEVTAERSDSAAADQVERFESFEHEIEKLKGQDYFDFLTDDCDISTVPPMSLFRVQGLIEVPEGFDMLSVMKRYAPLLEKYGFLASGGTDDVPPGLIRDVLEKANASVPITVALDEVTVSAKLQAQYLVSGDESDVENLEGEDVVLLCKVTAHQWSDSVVVFDPLKDFMHLNRAMRRSINKTDSLKSIEVPGPVLKATVVAVYH